MTRRATALGLPNADGNSRMRFSGGEQNTTCPRRSNVISPCLKHGRQGAICSSRSDTEYYTEQCPVVIRNEKTELFSHRPNEHLATVRKITFLRASAAASHRVSKTARAVPNRETIAEQMCAAAPTLAKTSREKRGQPSRELRFDRR